MKKLTTLLGIVLILSLVMSMGIASALAEDPTGSVAMRWSYPQPPDRNGDPRPVCMFNGPTAQIINGA